MNRKLFHFSSEKCFAILCDHIIEPVFVVLGQGSSPGHHDGPDETGRHREGAQGQPGPRSRHAR